MRKTVILIVMGSAGFGIATLLALEHFCVKNGYAALAGFWINVGIGCVLGQTVLPDDKKPK